MENCLNHLGISHYIPIRIDQGMTTKPLWMMLFSDAKIVSIITTKFNNIHLFSLMLTFFYRLFTLIPNHYRGHLTTIKLHRVQWIVHLAMKLCDSIASVYRILCYSHIYYFLCNMFQQHNKMKLNKTFVARTDFLLLSQMTIIFVDERFNFARR